MRAVIQRVKNASVTVIDETSGECEVVGSIGPGLCVLVGITHDDSVRQVEKIARKIAQLKILRAPDGGDDPKVRVGAEYIDAPVLLVSQFTLYADVRKGKKPSWSHAAAGSVAEPLFDALVEEVKGLGLHVETGQFGAMMEVSLVNDGPFTIIVEA